MLDRDVDDIMTNTTAESTKKVYASAIIRFVQWLWPQQDLHHLFTTGFRAFVKENGCTRDAVREWLNRRPFAPPIILERLHHHDFCRFLAAQRKTMAVFSLTVFYKEMKYKVTRSRQSTNKRLTEGKEPLTFSLYRRVCIAMLRSHRKSDVFTRLFLVLSWNLMCRAANTQEIRMAQIGWKEDALAIRFGHMKDDQEGDLPGDARYVYRSLSDSGSCNVLCNERIFHQWQAAPWQVSVPSLSKSIEACDGRRRCPSRKKELQNAGHLASDYGSATFVSSCSTAGPSASSICIRAGWSLPGVQDSHIRYEAAGDQVVGRFVSGVPFDTAQFATQPL